MKNKKKSKNSDGEKGYKNRKTEIKAEERNAEDLPSGLAANFRTFDFARSGIERVDSTGGMKRRVRASARRSRADLYQDKHTFYRHFVNDVWSNAIKNIVNK